MLSRLFLPFVRSGAILCYHGIATDRFHSPIHHTVAELEACVGVARELGTIVPLSDFVRAHQSGRSTAGLFAFTFDDAYASLAAAAAFLQREQVPITVFAVSDALDDGRVFWWDRLEAILNRVTVAQRDSLGDRWGIPQWFRDRWSEPEFLPRWELRQWIVARHAGRWPTQLEETLQDLTRDGETLPLDRSMTWAELSQFARTGLVEIGVHTRSHPALPMLATDEQHEEIGGCYHALRERFSTVVPVLAAPFGFYDSTTLAATRSNDLLACLSLGNRTLRYAGDSGVIPRFCMMHPQRNMRLAPRLSGIFDLIRAWSGSGTAEVPELPTTTQAAAQRAPNVTGGKLHDNEAPA